MLKLYNTIKRSIEPFVPYNEEKVTIYFCGPTVYDYAHIGNFRSYIFSDILRRYLELSGFPVELMMNITDVEDKTIANSQKAGMPLQEFTMKFSNAFFEDIETLRIKPASSYPKATEHMDRMISIINDLVKEGCAYIQEDGVYFDISAFERYGELSNLNAQNLKPSGRVKNDEYEKEDARDFVLWKAWTQEDGDVFWNAEIAGKTIKGRPGWHIECSAMSALLGKIDIHGGGVDLIFPHHENEICQSQCSNRPVPRYWTHCEHLLVDGKKMSKRFKNFYTLRDLLEKGHDPLAIRYELLSSHYRSQLNFTIDSLHAAKKTVDSINEFVDRLKAEIASSKAAYNKEIEMVATESYEGFIEAMDNDLNIPNAMKHIFNMMRIVNRHMDEGNADPASLEAIMQVMMRVNEVIDILRKEKELTPEEMQLIVEREDMRKKKNFEQADILREKLRKRHIIIEDTPSGVRWKKI